MVIKMEYQVASTYMKNLIWSLPVALFAGGLTAVIWTDFAQTGIMIGGATALAVLSKL